MHRKALSWVVGAAIAGWMAQASHVLGAASLVAKEQAVDTGNERVVAEHLRMSRGEVCLVIT